MVVGATSGAGKSTVAAALCRSFARKGLRVAPFKAQNMSNHSAVTADGGEVGRSQAVQAHAARVELDRRMNPILLKPTRNASHVVVLGDEVSTTNAADYGEVAKLLRSTVLSALDSLRGDYPIVVAEGAGGAAEINLLDRDLVNLPLAAAAGIPAILVVDIDRGGAFAAAHGTLDLLPDHLRQQVVGIVFNSFRGDASLLEDGIADLELRDGVPVLGVLPHLGDEPMLGVEDSLDMHVGRMRGAGARTGKPLRVAAVRYPSLSNPSDLDPLLIEPDVELSWVERPDDLARADLIVLPGSRATVNDLAWLRTSGFADALSSTDAWILGICGGYQMLGERIEDDLESGEGIVPGLALLPTHTVFTAPKTVSRSAGHTHDTGAGVSGYQIRWGRPQVSGSSWLQIDGEEEGAAVTRPTPTYGTSLHGLFDSDGFRQDFLTQVALDRKRDFTPSSTTYAAALDAQADRLADWIEAEVDMGHLLNVTASATPPGAGPGWR